MTEQKEKRHSLYNYLFIKMSVNCTNIIRTILTFTGFKLKNDNIKNENQKSGS